MNSIIRKILLGIVFFNIVGVQAQSDTVIQPNIQIRNVKEEKTVANLETALKDNFVKAKLVSAENRFLQGNVKVSHDDFSELVQKA